MAKPDPDTPDSIVAAAVSGPGQMVIFSAQGRVFRYSYDPVTGGIKQTELPPIDFEPPLERK